MNEKRMKIALEAIAHRGVPENTNMWLAISARLERKSPMYRLHTHPFMAILLALLILLALSGVAYAIGRSLGYIPGLGVVDQNTPFQVLAEPVLHTRDGITVTVKKAISNADQVFVVFTVEGIPLDSHSPVIGLDTCQAYPELHYPGGKSVKVYGGTSELLATGYQSQYKFASVPLAASDAVLFIPCIQGVLRPGILPENWELPLHFVPAPPDADLNMVQIAVSTPTTVPPKTAIPIPPFEQTPPSQTETPEISHLTVIQAIDIGNSYIFVGAFTPPVSPSNEMGIYAIADILLRDRNGQAIEWQPAFDLDLTPFILAAPGKDVWAVKFAKDFVPPIHITYRTQYEYSPVPQDVFTFEFDAGVNPQAEQEWSLNQEFQLAGHVVNLTKITAGSNSLTFFFSTEDESVESVGMNSLHGVEIEGYTPIDFAGNFGVGSWSLTKTYSEMPKGKLKISISDLYLFGEVKDWTMDWQP